MKSPFNNSNTTNTMAEIMMNKSADYWFYDIGVNVIQANTREKNTFMPWTFWQDSGYRK